jgi:hypothetical protein
MSRIDEAWKRMTGAAAEPHAPSVLERFAVEKAPRLDESKVSNFVSPGPRPVEGRPPAPRQAPAVPVFAPDQAMAASAPGQDEPNQEGPSTVDSEKLIDFRQIADYAWFLIGALRRHKILAAGTFMLVLAMTAAAVVLLPRTYHVQAKLLAQRNAVMAALSNPGRTIPWDADAPTRAAAETVLRRDNLVTLIKRTNLMEEWPRTRVPILKAKDAVMRLIRRPPTEDEKLDRLIGLLEARMWVVAGPVGDGTVTIDLDWPNAEMGYRLVESAQELFLDARQAAEAAAIGESIGILERYATTLHQDINGTLAELQRSQPQRRPAQAAPRTVATRQRAPLMPSIAATLPPVPAAALGSAALGAGLDDPQIPRLKAAVAQKRQEIATLEEARQRQLSELQGKLAQLTTVYTATHPSVVSAQQSLAALSHEPPQVVALKAAAEKLETEYLERVAAAQEILQEDQRSAEAAKQAAVVSAAEPAATPREAQTPPPAPAPEPPSANGDKDYANVRLRLQLNQLESVLERTDGARIELAVSQAAFKYRYTVIRPAQIPKEPVSPNLQLVFMAGLVGSLLLAVAAAVGKDLMSGRIVEQWQIERQLGLRVLGNLRMA